MKKVLVAPLNWGMGHATRCVPIIETLEKLGADIVLAGDGPVYHYFEKRFSHLELIRLPGHVVKYQSQGRWLMIPVLKGLPGFIHSFFNEHNAIKLLITKYNLGFIISDNRYGLWHREIPSALVTHQINIRLNGFWKTGTPFVKLVTNLFFSNFDEIWIPDYASYPGLAGRLSHPRKTPSNYKYLGPLSRFTSPAPKVAHPDYDFLAIVSGPEPQRTIFEKILVKLFHAGPFKTVIIRGLPGSREIIHKSPYLTLIPHLPDEEMHHMICHSAHLISRPGYSTLMDLRVLQRQAVLVPTPGQPEQEYLADIHRNNPQFRIISQEELQKLQPENFILPDTFNNEIIFPDYSIYLKEACQSIIKLL
ncbi:MAG: hypothetical protein PWR20_529 [Bacteroidales bacterium]|jgi:hypothetical protein|nr:hypothetical protein [Bacteroidales bacterium]MDN5328928.1 hypothetical protein [Bacteroidales bacterium]NLH51748.1 hypothetical protein [Bacteroidales bacterium]NPV35177.1 hypothetical protein [Bacteroidales bacterium]